MMRRQQQLQQDQQSRVFYELSALVLNILRSPPSPIPYSDQSSTAIVSSTRSSSLTQITPAGFASLMLGISLALMLCGSVTFFIGFMLMPWVFGLVMVLYIAGIVSTILVLGKSIISYAMPPPSSPRKDIPEITRSKGSSWLLMKLHGTIEKKKGAELICGRCKKENRKFELLPDEIKIQTNCSFMEAFLKLESDSEGWLKYVPQIKLHSCLPEWCLL